MANPPAQGPWRVFLSHTSELRRYPSGGSYIDKAEQAISAAGHVVVDMRDFPSIDDTTAQVCIDRVKGCDVSVGIFGTPWGTPGRDRPEVSYAERAAGAKRASQAMATQASPGSGRFGVFLSYARSDGEAFAKELRGRLNSDFPACGCGRTAPRSRGAWAGGARSNPPSIRWSSW